MKRVLAVVVLDQRPERIELFGSRFGARAEDGTERLVEHPFGGQLVDEPPEPAQQELLDESGAVGLGKQSSIEETNRLPAARATPLVLSGQQFLCNGVSVIVRKHMKRFELAIRDEGLA